jgi:hypothetical protein
LWLQAYAGSGNFGVTSTIAEKAAQDAVLAGCSGIQQGIRSEDFRTAGIAFGD